MTLLFTLLAMLLIVAAMAIGVLFGRPPIQGSCGGMARLGFGECEICGGDPAHCEARGGTSPSERSDLGYDVGKHSVDSRKHF